MKNLRPVAILIVFFLIIAIIVDSGLSGIAQFDFELRDTDYLGLFAHFDRSHDHS